MSELKEVTTKSGFVIKESWCRKCSKMRPASEFYECTDMGKIDTNCLLSVCKKCIQTLYDEYIEETQSMEKTIHKLCISLNMRFSNEAVSATRAHIQTLQENGKNVNFIFGIYKQKLLSTRKSMDKTGLEDITYEDVGTIFISEIINTKEIPIPQETLDFWGDGLSRKDIEFLETNYANFKQTHKADTYAEIVLLKEVCYTMLKIEKKRREHDPDTADDVKELQSLMKNLAISPNVANANAANKGLDTFGLWIQDIERDEPAQFLKTHPLGDMFRDVTNTEEYFQKYIVRPLKNFIMGSKDFNIEDTDNNLEDEYDELTEYRQEE